MQRTTVSPWPDFTSQSSKPARNVSLAVPLNDTSYTRLVTTSGQQLGLLSSELCVGDHATITQVCKLGQLVGVAA